MSPEIELDLGWEFEYDPELGKPPYPNPKPDQYQPSNPDKHQQSRERLQDELAEWISQTLEDDAPITDRLYLQAVDEVVRQARDLIEEEERRAAMFLLASGHSQASVSRELGLSRWGMQKRWPDLADQSLYWRWACLNEIPVHHWLTQLREYADEDLFIETGRHMAYADLEQYLSEYLPDRWWQFAYVRPLVEELLASPLPASPEYRAAAGALNYLFYDWDQVAAGRTKPARVDETALNATARRCADNARRSAEQETRREDEEGSS